MPLASGSQTSRLPMMAPDASGPASGRGLNEALATSPVASTRNVTIWIASPSAMKPYIRLCAASKPSTSASSVAWVTGPSGSATASS